MQCSPPFLTFLLHFFFMATVGGWLLLGEGEEVAWCAATVCSVPSVWAEGILLDGVRGLNWNGVTTHAHFQSFLLFHIFVQSRIPFMSPTQTDFVVSSRLLDDRWINIWTGCLAMVGCASVSVCGGLVDYALGFPRAER